MHIFLHFTSNSSSLPTSSTSRQLSLFFNCIDKWRLSSSISYYFNQLFFVYLHVALACITFVGLKRPDIYITRYITLLYSRIYRCLVSLVKAFGFAYIYLVESYYCKVFWRTDCREFTFTGRLSRLKYRIFMIMSRSLL